MNEFIAFMEGRLKKRPRRCHPGTPVAYCIHRPSRGLLKIGSTKNIKARMRNLAWFAGGDLLLLVGTLPGGLQKERELQRKFRSLRVHHEWFRDDPTIRAEFAAGGGA